VDNTLRDTAMEGNTHSEDLQSLIERSRAAGAKRKESMGDISHGRHLRIPSQQTPLTQTPLSIDGAACRPWHS